MSLDLEVTVFGYRITREGLDKRREWSCVASIACSFERSKVTFKRMHVQVAQESIAIAQELFWCSHGTTN